MCVCEEMDVFFWRMQFCAWGPLAPPSTQKPPYVVGRRQLPDPDLQRRIKATWNVYCRVGHFSYNADIEVRFQKRLNFEVNNQRKSKSSPPPQNDLITHKCQHLWSSGSELVPPYFKSSLRYVV